MIGATMPSAAAPSSPPGDSSSPRVRFLSLFVPDLEAARRMYAEVFGVEAVEDDELPAPHPYAAAGPVVFDLGGVKLGLYQCDMKTTHPGDVGIGLRAPGSASEVSDRVAAQGGRVFFGPRPSGPQQSELAVFVLPDRHFFEVLGARPPAAPLD